MGADIYLKSVWEPWWRENEKRSLKDGKARTASIGTPDEFLSAIGKLYDELSASGAYFRNAYNAGDVMWAMGLSWHDTVLPMLVDGYLPVERARELLTMIEARRLTKERLTQHYFDHMTNGADQHPIGAVLRLAQDLEDREEDNKRLLAPNFEDLAGFLRKHQSQLVALLRKSIALNEPLECSL
jgi:hypothetical protein